MPMTKPGIKSSEFWGKVVVQVLALAALFGLVDLDIESQEAVAFAVAGIVEAAYSVGRGIAKAHEKPTVTPV